MTEFSIIYPPTVPWAGELPGQADPGSTGTHFSVRQRPHHLLASFARLGWRSIFVDSLPGTPGCWEIEPHLYVVRGTVPAGLVTGKKVLLTSHPPGGLRAKQHYQPDVWAHDVIDSDVSDGPFRHWQQGKAQCLQQADVLLATSPQLLEECQTAYARKSWLITNGADTDHFSRRSRGEDGFAVPPTGTGKTALFVGALAEWIDWTLVGNVAALLPDWTFQIVGPKYDPSVTLPTASNIVYGGYVPYAELPQYLASADVALSPFVKSQMTHAVAGCKITEYLAAGLPVVGTSIRTQVEHPYITCADDPRGFADAIVAAHQTPRAPLIRYARQYDWTVLTAKAMGIIEAAARNK